jgi:hypothetical protein
MKKFNFFMSLKDALPYTGVSRLRRAGPTGGAFAEKEELRMTVRLGLFCALVLPLCSCASHRSVSPTRANVPAAAPQEAAPSAVSAELEQAQALMVASKWAQADALLTDLVSAKNFQQLSLSEQHGARVLAAGAALQLREPERALSLIQAACAMSNADSRDWFIRTHAAVAASDSKDALLALTVLAQRWPQQLARTQNTELIEFAMSALDKLDSESERYQLLSALHRVVFVAEPAGASEWWREFALLQLARGERASALQALARVTDPYVVVSIRADKRFDPLRAALGEGLTVPAAAQRSIQDAVRTTQLNPSLLQPMSRLADLLVASLRFQQALQVTDAAIERQDAQGSEAWSDYEREYAAILNQRADALYAMGRWQAAVAQLQAASGLKSAAREVSQIINLADLYNDLGRPREARDTLQRMSATDTSPYGVMQVELERLRAAVQLHDPGEAERALTFLRTHTNDAPSAFQEALLNADRPGEGAALLISRLADLKRRSAALLAVQSYTEGDAPPPQVQEIQRRWRALIARHDVQEAIGHVGRVEHYPLLAGQY